MAALALVGCDLSSTAQAGTSSETQTSLQELATRMDGLHGPILAARQTPVASRKLSTPTDTSIWTAFSATSSWAVYQKYIGGPAQFLFESETNTFTSASTFRSEVTSKLMDGTFNSWTQTWGEYQVCPDSKQNSTNCRMSLPGSVEKSFSNITFRNGTIFTPIDSSTGKTRTSYVIDNRWIIRSAELAVGFKDTTGLWFDVIELGRLIGHAKEPAKYENGTFRMPITEFVDSLRSIIIYDLAGNVIPPDRSKETTRITFPEDSLGLFIDSIRIDSSAGIVHMGISWRFHPSPAIPTDSLSRIRIYLQDSSPFSWAELTRPNPIRSPEGHSQLELPLDSVNAIHPTTIQVKFSGETSFNAGTRSQASFIITAICEAAYPGSL
jgi:hypothetical protein